MALAKRLKNNDDAFCIKIGNVVTFAAVISVTSPFDFFGMNGLSPTLLRIVSVSGSKLAMRVSRCLVLMEP